MELDDDMFYDLIDERDALRDENREIRTNLQYQIDEAKAEIARHHQDFALVRLYVHDALEDPTVNGADFLRRIRMIVG